MTATQPDELDVTDETSAEILESRARRVLASEAAAARRVIANDAAIAVARMDERLKGQDKALERIEKAQEKMQGSIETLTNHVNHEVELIEKRIGSLEDTRKDQAEDAKKQYDRTVRTEISLDARKVAIMGFLVAIFIAFLYIGSAIVQHILFG
jgi:hypothetical protein